MEQTTGKLGHGRRRWREGAGAGQGQATAGRARREGGGEDEREGECVGAGVLEKVCRCVFICSFVIEAAAGGEALHAREGAGTAVYG
jgi:hypothetical protein